MKYLLPCECGRKVPVSTSDAGQSVTCECGRMLPVPSLIALRRLEPAPDDATNGKRRRSVGSGFGDDSDAISRYSLFFGSVAALCGVVSTIFVIWVYRPFSREITSDTTPEDLYQWWLYLRQGIDTPPQPREMLYAQHQELWQMLTWGGVSLLVVGFGLIITGVVLKRRARAGR